ncbi:hypothetical protein CLV56_1383 [Mumia flava]|uniref:Uncharacterized protein n=1 Tax=Mumia flava TaxID=1348852 RepID=A0A0B2BTZ0_9ACTN|nr:hypothetical protein [Mumia flava]PJJ57162.1 hypothetical protein CLV56_1383 [Mumia flava]
MTTSTIDRSAWERTTQRQRALRAVTDAAQDPAATAAAVRRARADAFDSLDDLLLAAYAQWQRTVDAQLDLALEREATVSEAVRSAWSAAGDALPGTAALLEQHRDHPAVVQAHARHARTTRRRTGASVPTVWRTPTGSTRPRRSCGLGLRRRVRTLIAG